MTTAIDANAKFIALHAYILQQRHVIRLFKLLKKFTLREKNQVVAIKISPNIFSLIFLTSWLPTIDFRPS